MSDVGSHLPSHHGPQAKLIINNTWIPVLGPDYISEVSEL